MYFFHGCFPSPLGNQLPSWLSAHSHTLLYSIWGSICFFRLWKYTHFPGLTEDFPSLPFCTIFSCFGEFDRKVVKGKQLHLTIFYQKQCWVESCPVAPHWHLF